MRRSGLGVFGTAQIVFKNGDSKKKTITSIVKTSEKPAAAGSERAVYVGIPSR